MRVPQPGPVSPPPSKADYVYDVLRREIHESRLPGGTSLRAAAVAARLGVSVTPVREALRRLETDRLVTYAAHRGATVVDLGPDALREFYGVRAAVEGVGARFAAARIDAVGLERLESLHDRMVRDAARGRTARLAALSDELHLAVTDIGGPAFLGAQARAVRTSFPVPRGASLWLDPALREANLTAHAELIDALRDADATRAERVMVAHVTASGRFRIDGQGHRTRG